MIHGIAAAICFEQWIMLVLFDLVWKAIAEYLSREWLQNSNALVAEQTNIDDPRFSFRTFDLIDRKFPVS